MILLAGTAHAEEKYSKGSRLKTGDTVEYFGLKPLVQSEDKPEFINIGDFVGPDAKQPYKLLLISFFASWCEACRHELPQIENYFLQYSDKGLIAFYICIDTDKEGTDKSRQFIRDNKFRARTLHDSYNIVASRYFYDEFVLPASYLVGSNGRVLAVLSGGGDTDMKALGYELDRFLNNVRADSSPARTDQVLKEK